MPNSFGKKSVLVTLAVVALLGLVAHVTLDAMRFHRIVESQQGSGGCCSWYVLSWVKMPYTNFRLSSVPASDYWTTNGSGMMVLIRDVQYKGAGFWTELHRVDGSGHDQ